MILYYRIVLFVKCSIIYRNKKSVAVDLQTPEGKQIIYDLAAKCDVVVENFLPGKNIVCN